MMRLFFLPAIFVISTFCLLLMIKLAPDFAETSNKYKQVKNNGIIIFCWDKPSDKKWDAKIN